MSFTKQLRAKNPFTNKMMDLERALVWSVEPQRGDLYVLVFEDEDILVKLLGHGIVNKPENVKHEPMDVMVDTSEEYRRVVALPIDCGDGWVECIRLSDFKNG